LTFFDSYFGFLSCREQKNNRSVSYGKIKKIQNKVSEKNIQNISGRDTFLDRLSVLERA